MKYSQRDVIQFIKESGIPWVQLWFSDAKGELRSAEIPAGGLERAFAEGFQLEGELGALRLFPDPETLALLPRFMSPGPGRTVRLFCSLRYPDGTEFEGDCRAFLKHAVEYARGCGCRFTVGSTGSFTVTADALPGDSGGMFSPVPEDQCAGLRREVAQALENMEVPVEGAFHGSAPGDQSLRLGLSDPVEAADALVSLRALASASARSTGRDLTLTRGLVLRICCIKGAERVFQRYRGDLSKDARAMTAAVLNRLPDLSLFMGKPRGGTASWATEGEPPVLLALSDHENNPLELRCADLTGNIWLTLGLWLYALMEGVKTQPALPPEGESGARLPGSPEEARALAEASEWLRDILPEELLKAGESP